MHDELEKIDMIRERIGISYREAKETLEKAGGDLIEALAMAEEIQTEKWTSKIYNKGDGIFKEIKTYLEKGSQTKIKLKNGDKTLAEFPATIGVLGLIAALVSTELAVLAGIGAVAAAANNIYLEIEGEDGQTKTFSLNKKDKK